MKSTPHLFSVNNFNTLNLILQFSENIFTNFRFDAIYKGKTDIIEVITVAFKLKFQIKQS